jgi:asparagine synthase (glutamine-hydrolysing)
MCGIYGELVLTGGQAPDPAVARAMGAAIVHRGPDDDGLYHDEQAAFGLRRLSIIDLSGGHQPIANEDGSIVVVCNGEIYNFRELREELKVRGHRFRTGSDVEVLVHLYEEEGDAFVARLRGMFGFALWDRPRRRLLIGRDRLGIKPVYFAQLGSRLVFASETKALLTRPDYTPDLDRTALAEFLALGYVPAPGSLFAGIRKLRAGHLLVAENGTLAERAYWQFRLAPDHQASEADWIDRIRSAISDSVESQMVSDVPIGAFLSGGIDSSTIVACMGKSSLGAVRTYAIGYAGSSGAAIYNELDHARRVATAFGTEHREILVEPAVVSLLPRLVWHLDEPTADSALVTSSLVAEFARRDVKVILSGVGGDELFGGYDRYKLPHFVGLMQRLPASIRRGVVRPLLESLPVARHSRLLNLFRYARKVSQAADLDATARYHQLLEVFPAGDVQRLLDLPALPGSTALGRTLAAHASAEDLDQAMAADLATQLTDDLLLLTDKVTMAHSLECRVPLLDERLVDLAATLPARLRVRGPATRYILKQALRGVIPDATIERKKRGFGAPFGAWLTRELAPVTDELLGPAAVRRRGLLDPAFVGQVVAEHRSQRADNTDHLMALITLELWCRLFLDRTEPGEVAARLERQTRAAA